MLKNYVCKCDTKYESGGYCLECNTMRTEIINDELVGKILQQVTIDSPLLSQFPEIKLLAVTNYANEFGRYLEYTKRLLPLAYAKRIDDAIVYALKIGQKQPISRFVMEEDRKTQLIGLHKRLKSEIDSSTQFDSELVVIERMKLLTQINAIENIFNQMNYYERMEENRK